jgi:hypothetical protein
MKVFELNGATIRDVSRPKRRGGRSGAERTGGSPATVF